MTDRLLEEVHDSTELIGAMSGKPEVFNIDLRGLDRSPFQAVVLEYLREVNFRSAFVTSAAEILNLAIGEASPTGGYSRKIESIPIKSQNGGGVQRAALKWKCPVVDEGVELIAHPIRESALFNKVNPRGSVEG